MTGWIIAGIALINLSLGFLIGWILRGKLLRVDAALLVLHELAEWLRRARMVDQDRVMNNPEGPMYWLR
jgi:hypothetical protein